MWPASKKRNVNPGTTCQLVTVSGTLEKLQAIFRVLQRVQRLYQRLPFVTPLAVFPLRVLLVQVAGIRQHDLAQRFRRVLHIDRSVVALFNEQRHST